MYFLRVCFQCGGQNLTYSSTQGADLIQRSSENHTDHRQGCPCSPRAARGLGWLCLRPDTKSYIYLKHGIFVMTCRNAFNVRPSTTPLPPAWPRDATGGTPALENMTQGTRPACSRRVSHPQVRGARGPGTMSPTRRRELSDKLLPTPLRYFIYSTSDRIKTHRVAQDPSFP